MNRKFLIATTALAIAGYAAAGTSSALAGDCHGELDRLNNKILSNDKNYRSGALAGMEKDIRQLRNAALIFAENGNDEACEDVVEGIEDVLEKRHAELSESDDGLFDPDAWNENELQRLATAKSPGEMSGTMTASYLIGADVRNLQNEDLAEVEDVVFHTSGTGASYVLVSHGGFLGIGDEQIAVPMSNVKVTPDGDPIVVLNIERRAAGECAVLRPGFGKCVREPGLAEEERELFRRS